MKLITGQAGRFRIRFRAFGIPHTAPGTVLGRDIQANSKESALILFKSTSPQCEIIDCVEQFDDPFNSANPLTDVAQPNGLIGK